MECSQCYKTFRHVNNVLAPIYWRWLNPFCKAVIRIHIKFVFPNAINKCYLNFVICTFYNYGINIKNTAFGLLKLLNLTIRITTRYMKTYVGLWLVKLITQLLFHLIILFTSIRTVIFQ